MRSGGFSGAGLCDAGLRTERKGNRAETEEEDFVQTMIE